MSGQLGATAGLGVAEDKLSLKARALLGCYKINAALADLPLALTISKGVGEQNVLAEGTDSLQFICLTSGRIKKFGIYIKEHTLTQDAELVLRKNGADFGTPLLIPTTTPAETTLLSPDNLDLEFSELDDLNYILRFVAGGAGGMNMSWSTYIEFDSDSAGEFDADVAVYYHQTPSSISIRRNIALQGNWISTPVDQPVMPALYNGKILAVACNVPTGFNTDATHQGRALSLVGIVQTSYLQQNFIVGETGTKIGLKVGNTRDFIDTDTLALLAGQSVTATIEPINTLIVIKLEVL